MKKAWITVVVLLALGGGVAAYFYWWLPKQNAPAPVVLEPQPTSTVAGATDIADWKTYTDEKYGFEFKYPEEWSLNFTNEQQGSSTNSFGIQCSSDKFSFGGGSGYKCGGQVWVEEGVSDLLGWFLSERRLNLDEEKKQLLLNSVSVMSELRGTGSVNIKTSDIIESYREDKINGSPAVIETIECKNDAWQACVFMGIQPNTTFYAIQHGNTVVSIKIGTFSQNTDSPVFERVLSTFKFISPTSSVDTSTWKTYKNEKYGFEVKYPADLQIKLNDEKTAIFPDTPNVRLSFREGGMDIFINPRPIGLESESRKVIEENTFDLGKTTLDRLTLYDEGEDVYWIEATAGDNGEIFIASGPAPNLEQLTLYKQILSTFKFTK